MDCGCVSKKDETSFQKLLAQNINRSKMDSMIYGIIKNGRRGIGYVTPRNDMFNPKPKEMVIKLKALYSNFTYGHTYDTYFYDKSLVDKSSGTN